jgi:hypothetical protein
MLVNQTDARPTSIDKGENQSEERFLSPQADHFTGVKWEEEKVGLLRSK